MTSSSKPKKFGILDAVVIVLVVTVIVLAVVKVINENTFTKESEYLVTITITDISNDNAAYFDDAVMYLTDGEIFGETSGTPVMTPSQYYYENDKGYYVSDYSTDGSVDIKTDVLVSGVMTESGFMLNNSTTLAPNMTVELTTDTITFTATVTDIVENQRTE